MLPLSPDMASSTRNRSHRVKVVKRIVSPLGVELVLQRAPNVVEVPDLFLTAHKRAIRGVFGVRPCQQLLLRLPVKKHRHAQQPFNEREQIKWSRERLTRNGTCSR